MISGQLAGGEKLQEGVQIGCRVVTVKLAQGASDGTAVDRFLCAESVCASHTWNLCSQLARDAALGVPRQPAP
jgi:hypothetical protein